MTKFLNANTRKWIYDIVMAVIPLLTILGVFNSEVAAQVMLIAAAVLGTGATVLARANVSPSDAEVSREFKG